MIVSPLEKTVIYIDMDHTLCDYAAGFKEYQRRFPELQFPQSVEGFYLNLKPLEGAVETFHWLNNKAETEVFILTAPSVKNVHSYSEKRLWVEKFLGFDVVHRLIISAHKGLNQGDFLIDDYASGKGQEYFSGTLIQFGSKSFPDWKSVKEFFTLVDSTESDPSS
ncbi:hypothetical protein QQM79_03650 [Marinobacteraceae bacterium S3BR75-40.1]